MRAGQQPAESGGWYVPSAFSDTPRFEEDQASPAFQRALELGKQLAKRSGG